jgi:hypothetical protein
MNMNTNTNTGQKKYRPTEQHLNHPAEIRLLSRGPHGAELRCVPCGQHIKWLSPAEVTVFQMLDATSPDQPATEPDEF